MDSEPYITRNNPPFGPCRECTDHFEPAPYEYCYQAYSEYTWDSEPLCEKHARAKCDISDLEKPTAEEYAVPYVPPEPLTPEERKALYAQFDESAVLLDLIDQHR